LKHAAKVQNNFEMLDFFAQKIRFFDIYTLFLLPLQNRSKSVAIKGSFIYDSKTAHFCDE